MPKNKKPRGAPLHGMLLLDKPQGLSSNRALQQAKRLLNAQKAGHTGSLDPIATGLLPLCFGAATKIAGMFLHADKTYETVIALGVETATGDIEGEVLARKPVQVTPQQLTRALGAFEGETQQIPPMYSALKHEGQPLYKLARRGVEVERRPRKVKIYSLELIAQRESEIEVRIVCSGGFYVRSFAADLGKSLGCGAHVAALRRTGVGALRIERAVSLAQLECIAGEAARAQLLQPLDACIAHLPEVRLTENLAAHFCEGRAVGLSPMPDGELFRVYNAAGFLGLGERAEGKLAPKRLFLELLRGE